MSYILDALKKSHQARRRGSVAISRSSENVHRIAPSLPDNGLWFSGGIILLVGVTAVVILFWRNANNHTPVIPPEIVASDTAAQPAIESIKNEIPRLVPAEKTANYRSPVRDLAEEARITFSNFEAAIPNTVIVKPNGNSEVGNSIQRKKLSPPISQIANVTPLLQQMPTDFQRALPHLAVTIHVYSPQESQRILFINNREYHKGDQFEGDITVEEIVPDGAILSFRGEKFKLGRPR